MIIYFVSATGSDAVFSNQADAELFKKRQREIEASRYGDGEPDHSYVMPFEVDRVPREFLDGSKGYWVFSIEDGRIEYFDHRGWYDDVAGTHIRMQDSSASGVVFAKNEQEARDTAEYLYLTERLKKYEQVNPPAKAE